MRRLLATLAFGLFGSAAQADVMQPLLGRVPLTVIGCALQGYPIPTSADMLVYSDPINAALRFWNGIGAGNYEIRRAVQPWVRVNITYQQGKDADRGVVENACLNAARINGTAGPENGVRLFLIHPEVDTYGGNGRMMTGTLRNGDRSRTNGNVLINDALVSHELGHGIGLPHAMGNLNSTRPEPPYVYGDQFAVMGPNMSDIAPYSRDRLGLYERDRVFRFGWDMRTEHELTLADPNSNSRGYHLVRIPFDNNDPNHYLLVEWSRKYTDRARTMRQDGRLYIYEVKVPGRSVDPWGNPMIESLRSVLLYEGRDNRTPLTPTFVRPIQSYNRGPVQIDVISGGPRSDSARVRIRNSRANWCAPGFVWREANASDKACVSGRRRAEVARENAGAARRRNPDGSCKYGAVWREATGLSDKVCVTPASRKLVREENTAQTSTRSPRLAWNALGPNTCKPGLVWREAHQRDWVCVTPARRAAVAEENRLAPGRTGSNGRCKRGFVWRETALSDRTCVPFASRSLTAQENANRLDTRRWRE